jgi:signal transduction histidine kinase
MVRAAWYAWRNTPLVARLFAPVVLGFIAFATATFWIFSAQIRSDAHSSACKEIMALGETLRTTSVPGLSDTIAERSEWETTLYYFETRNAGFVDANKARLNVPFRMLAAATTRPDMHCTAPTDRLGKFLRKIFDSTQPNVGEANFDGKTYVLVRLGGLSAPAELAVLVPIVNAFPYVLAEAAGAILFIVLMGFVGLRANMGYRKRIALVNAAFMAVQRGDLFARPPEDLRKDELGQLAAHVRRVLDRVQSQIEQLRLVSQEVAHELKRPLSPIFHKIWVAREKSTDPETWDMLDDAYQRILKFGKTLDELLNLRNELFDQKPKLFETVLLTDLLTSVADEMRPLAKSRGLELVVQLEPDIGVRASRGLLTILFENLLENAIKYTIEGTVTLILEKSGQTFTVRIRDTGPGIDEEDAARLITPMYRAATVDDVEGHGLGLTVALGIVMHHDFTLHYHNSHPGLEVTVRGNLA